MAGETDLLKLLRNMEPVMDPHDYVFVSVSDRDFTSFASLEPRGMFVEDEGTTLILRRDVALANGFEDGSVMRCITLTVHSSLEAVGLTAAFATTLARAGCSANVVAGYHHDHIFVPAGQADRALEVLKAMAVGGAR